MTKTIAAGNQAVRIIANDPTGPFHAIVMVNTRGGQMGQATGVTRSFNTMKGAERWAAKELAR